MEAIEGEILMDDIDKFTEVGACGTAAVVAPIGSIYYFNIFFIILIIF